MVVSPSSYTNFTFIFWKPFCFRVAFNFFFFFFQNCTKPNQTTTRDSLIYFHPHTKCSWFIQSLGFPWRVSGIASFFIARKIRYLTHWRNHSALRGFPWHESRYGSEICLSCFNLNSSICFFYFYYFFKFKFIYFN